MLDDICTLSATQLVDLYRTGQVSPVEVACAVLDRIERLDGLGNGSGLGGAEGKPNNRINAFRLVDADGAMAQARESEARWQRGAPNGLVDGVPTTIKDLIVTKGWPTLRGSRTINPEQAWDEDGPPVARMREHGAVLLGKTNTPEFGWKGVTDSPLTGVTVNPWNAALTPGGSSGGAAAAAALGMGPLHIATDGGGSIRIPAAFCGLFGHKPTFGLVPVHPHSPAGTLWHQGPIVRTVADAALMLTVISQPDRRDWLAVPHHPVDYRATLDQGVAGLRIAYSPDLGYVGVDPEVAALVADAVNLFADMGAEVDQVDPGFSDPLEIMITLWSVALALAVAPLTEEQRALVDPPILEIAARGAGHTAVEYREAERAREALGRHMQHFHERYDLLITPQLPLTAFEAGHEVPPGSGMTRWWEWSPFTYPFNLTQQPAASLPCGFTDDGLPVAVQVVGAKFADATVLRACRAYEAGNPFVMPPMPV
jgi:aspartyl-tRNA(Asn)/glutamyl-tRNA(Gln) amidotransferase subunit A